MTDWSEGTEVTIDIEPSMLNLAYTLDCGQAFRWRCRPDGWWTGVIRGHAVRLRQEHTQVIGQIFPSLPEADRFLVSYFRLDVDLKKLYQQFAEMDPWIQSAVSTFSGLRVLDQEPQETLLSYVCSTANSVPRISRSVDEMSRRYGEFIGHIAGEDYFAFPIAARLANAQVDVLAKECGLGWRGKNLQQVAREVESRPDGWPEQLRSRPYREAKSSLMELRGIGAKIADCVCLFSLEKDDAVPVDTHIWAVAKEIFQCEIPTKTLTPSTYEAVADLFVRRYGAYAGWAQEYLYLQRRAAQGRVRSICP